MLLSPYTTNRAIICCEQCPGQPILPTHREDTDTRRCIRCQGEHRVLPQPHPEDHLCKVCSRECPTCQAPTPKGGRCRACQGLCRTCSAPLPKRPDPAEKVTHVAPEDRKDRHRKWKRTYYARSWDWDQCEDCQEAETAANPVRAVLAALPDKLIRACGGNISPDVIEMVQSELQWHTVRWLAARIERRWWGGWAGRPLQRKADEKQEGYRADDVVLWLLTPTQCSGRCEDGWRLAPPERPDQDDQPCTVCRGGRLLTTPREAADDWEEEKASSPAVERTVAEAVAYRPPTAECTGKGGTCGVPVAAPYTQCPACLDWPWCECRRRRYDPDQAIACPACSTR
ncbi:hypothetical protein AB0I82_35250 [Streptomyces sp. NPDC050315]|uniref:hypothetical protein n=1 Tax=Streptomyces sp. NPDC050315 TaxID=3155039 RepID=UPI003430059F